MASSKLDLTVAWKNEIAPNVLHIGFEIDTPLEFIPGQFITLRFKRPNDPRPALRSFSIANSPPTKTLEIAAHLVDKGIASTFFNEMKPGDKVPGAGAIGKLVLPTNDLSRYILIATGTGVTPYRAMIPELAKRIAEKGIQVDLYFGTRTTDEILFEDEFLTFANQQPNFNYYVCLSREQSVSESHHLLGRATQYLDSMKIDNQKDIVLLCGNPDMIDDAIAYFDEKSFPKEQLLREKYLFSK